MVCRDVAYYWPSNYIFVSCRWSQYDLCSEAKEDGTFYVILLLEAELSSTVHEASSSLTVQHLVMKHALFVF